MKEAEIINNLRNENEEFKKIEEEHRKLEESLSDIDKKKYLTPDLGGKCTTEEITDALIEKISLLR